MENFKNTFYKTKSVFSTQFNIPFIVIRGFYYKIPWLYMYHFVLPFLNDIFPWTYVKNYFLLFS